MLAASPWNSLEIVKLLVAGLTPIFVALAAFVLNRRLKSLEAAQWSRQKIIERRIAAYDDLAPKLNEMFCFFAYVGTWKEMTPLDIVSLKRTLDRCAYVSAPLFDPRFLPLYDALVERCFQTNVGWGQDARLRTHVGRRRDAMGVRWEPGWDRCFSPREEATAPSDVKLAYVNLMAYLARAMGATEVDARMLGAGSLPGGFDARQVTVTSRIPADVDVLTDPEAA